MSGTAYTWAFETGRRLKLRPTERMLLIAIAERSNGLGYCWPSQDTLANDTGLTARSVRSITPELVKLGLIWIERTRESLRYHLIRSNGVDGEPEHAKPARPEAAKSFHNAAYIPPKPAVASASNRKQLPLRQEATSVVDPEAASVSRLNNANLSPQDRQQLPLIPEAASTEPSKEPSKVRKEGKEDSRSNVPKLSQPRQSSPRGDGATEPPGFKAFWDDYPRKVGRRAAATAFANAIKRGAHPDDILDGLECHQFNLEPRFQPHPTTWLNQERWRDEAGNGSLTLNALEASARQAEDDFQRLASFSRPRLVQ